MTACAYCTTRRRDHTDHLIKKAHVRRRPSLLAARNDPRYQVPACKECNWRIGTRNRVPESHAYLIAELEEMTGNKYATFSGDPEDLREVVK